MSTEAQIRAVARADAKTAYRVPLKFNKNTDTEIIAKLESVPNKQGYIKELIRKDIRS